MEYVIGAILGVVVGAFTSLIGMDRDRALYPAILIVVAAYYVLFAVMGGSSQALVIEIAVGVLFVALAVAGFRSTLWFAVAGLVSHAIFDTLHAQFIQNPGVPTFWPAFCQTIDAVLGLYLAWLILRNRIRPVEA